MGLIARKNSLSVINLILHSVASGLGRSANLHVTVKFIDIAIKWHSYLVSIIKVCAQMKHYAKNVATSDHVMSLKFRDLEWWQAKYLLVMQSGRAWNVWEIHVICQSNIQLQSSGLPVCMPLQADNFRNHKTRGKTSKEG